MVFSVFSQAFYIKIRRSRNTPPGVQNSDVNSDFNFTQAWQRADFLRLTGPPARDILSAERRGRACRKRYVLPIVMLVAWPLHVAFVRVAIEGVLRAAISKTMIRKQRKAHPGFWNWLTYRGVASAIPLPIQIWYYRELLKYPIAALAFYVLMWLLGVPLDPLRKWPAIILISSELILVAYYVFFHWHKGQGQDRRMPAWTVKRFSPRPQRQQKAAVMTCTENRVQKTG